MAVLMKVPGSGTVKTLIRADDMSGAVVSAASDIRTPFSRLPTTTMPAGNALPEDSCTRAYPTVRFGPSAVLVEKAPPSMTVNGSVVPGTPSGFWAETGRQAISSTTQIQ